jgi:hypothetical protein
MPDRHRRSNAPGLAESGAYPLSVEQSKQAKASGVHAAAERVREAQARVTVTADDRDAPGGLERWHAALLELNRAMSQLYPPTFEADVRRLKDGDPGAIETAIRFLEADPWAFRTGYTKEEILRRLRRLELTTKQKARLSAVILHQVDQKDRREFRQYCLLAPSVDDDTLREGLLARLRSGDGGRARRALWVLDALGGRLEPDDQTIARSIIETTAASSYAWQSVDWLRTAIRRHGDRAWLNDLAKRATSAGNAGEAALFVVGMIPTLLTSEQHRSLDARLEIDIDGKLAVVRTAAAFAFPTGDIDSLYADIEHGVASSYDR